MPAFGQITTQKARQEHKCHKCEKPILKKTFYLRAAASEKEGYWNTKWHIYCWIRHMLNETQTLRDVHIAYDEGHLAKRTRLAQLGKEIRKRRNILQTYITNRDLPALEKAYRLGGPERIFKVMWTISDRWEELYKMGVPFRAELLPKNNKPLRDSLEELITQRDYRWLEMSFRPETNTVEGKIKALRRSLEDEYQPERVWP